jgi:hypothetical protein
MTVVGFGIIDVAGTRAYDADHDDAVLTWPSSGDAALEKLIAARMQAIVRQDLGRDFWTIAVTDAPLRFPSHRQPLPSRRNSPLSTSR